MKKTHVIIVNDQSKLLLAEILLYRATSAIQKNKSEDSMVASKIFSSHLIEILKTIVVINNNNNNSGDSSNEDNDISCLIVNTNILRLTLFDVASCLICMKQYQCAKRCLDYVNTMMNMLTRSRREVSEESQVKRLSQMMDQVQKLIEKEEQQRREEAAAAALKFSSSSTKTTISTPSTDKKTVPKKSDESDDDFSEGWPSSDDDDDGGGGGGSSLGLSLGRNVKVTFGDDDDDEEDDDDDSGWPSSDEGSERKAPLAGFIDNSDEAAEESIADVANEELFPNRYRFFKSREFDQLDNSPSNVPSSLLTLRTDDGGQSFKDAGELKRWLQSIVSKHSKVVDRSKSSSSDEEKEVHNEVSLVESFQTNLKYMDTVCIIVV